MKPLGAALATEQTHAVFKSDELEVIRLVLGAGQALPPHQVPGEITIQCIEGALDVGVGVDAGGAVRRLGAGQLLYLRGGVMHDVRAVADASALVTIVLRR